MNNKTPSYKIPTLSNEILYSPNDVCEIIQRSKQTLWRWWSKEGIFPKPIVINGRCVGWPQSVIVKWLEENVAA